MVREAWTGDRLIGMVLLRDGWEEDYYGRPPVYPLGCAGKIVNFQPLEDGRFNIVLEGLKRFEIKDESQEQPFRLARVGWVENADGVLGETIRQGILQRVQELLHRDLSAGEITALLGQGRDDASLIYTLSYTLPFSPLERQFLLESVSLEQQGLRLLDLMAFILSALNGRGEGTG